MTKPNIIVILADDMSYWDISHFGQKEFSTPNIDRLAREGMVFSNAYAASPECAPSRAGLLTGRHMGHCQIRRLGTDVPPELHHRPYLTDQETMADVLKDAGYETIHAGKWHVGEPDTPGMPHLKGFEHTLSFDHSGDKDQQYTYPDHLWLDGERIEVPENEAFRWRHEDNHFDEHGRFVPGGTPDPVKARHAEDIFLEYALEQIRRPHDKPFFLYYASTLTHAMWPNELRELKDKQAPWTIDQKKWAGQCTQLDRSVGAIIAELKEQRLDDNTIVLFASDNGYAAWGYAQGSAKRGVWEDDPVLKNKGPWDRGKFIAAHGGVIVPTIAWGPGLVPQGETQRAITFYDYKATFAELAGAKMQQDTDGVSFAALLSGQTSEYAKRPFLYWEQGGRGLTMQSVLLDERFFAYRDAPDQPICVFDLTRDVGCDHDLATQHPELVQRAGEHFENEHQPHPWYPRLTEMLREKSE